MDTKHSETNAPKIKSPSPHLPDLGTTFRQLLWETGLTAWILLMGLGAWVLFGHRHPGWLTPGLPIHALAMGLGLGGLVCMGVSRIGIKR
ncbi:MAG: hypothetical protein VKL00_09265 [Synechococcales bacterium]|nr:hypothetical protein [Cyanobacteria bacterium REEB444]MEB3125796.1 hypothetical protein [Synechococcales bacterium]